MKIIYDDIFDHFENDPNSRVFYIVPNIFNDGRGSFSEVLKQSDFQFNHFKQINRSSSSENTLRGCHAQKGEYCQGKLVESLTTIIFDIIIDARPDSKTYGLFKIYVLSPIMQNKLWVPRGFLHSFIVPPLNCLDFSETNFIPSSNAIFQYYCDNEYNKESEIVINPMSIIPIMLNKMSPDNMTDQASISLFNLLKELFDKDKNTFNISEKDKTGLDAGVWFKSIKKEYSETGKLWYK